MIALEVQPHHVNLARERYKENRFLERSERNATGQKGVITGCFAEVMIEEWMAVSGIRYRKVFCKEHDYTVGSLKVEAKGKARSVQPRGYFNVSVPAYQLEFQDADYYIHASMYPFRYPHTRAYIVAGTTKEIMLRGRLSEEGEKDVVNGQTTKQDTWNVHISDAIPIEQVRQILCG